MLSDERLHFYTRGACWMFAEQAAAVLDRPIVALGTLGDAHLPASDRWWGHLAVLLEDGSVFDAHGARSKDEAAAEFLKSHTSWFEVTDFEASIEGHDRDENPAQVLADVRVVLGL